MDPATVTNTSLSCNKTASPFCDQPFELVVLEVVYLSFVSVIGTTGNLVLIFSIVILRRINKYGNMFLVNLAFADLLVTGFAIPTVIAAVLNKGNVFSDTGCRVVGFIVTVLCTVSLNNLFAIAANRYVAIAHHSKYQKVFSKTRIRLIVLSTWVYAILLTIPTVVGWSDVGYDEKMQVCTWLDTVSLSYSIFLVVFAMFIPLTGLMICYAKLYKTAREQGKWVRDISKTAGNMNQYQRSLQRDITLLKTLFITVVVFLLFWIPYGITSIFFGKLSNPIGDKICGYLALTNSSVNFIIYGVTNPVYRQGYLSFLSKIVCCSSLKERLIESSERNNLGSTIHRGRRPHTSRASYEWTYSFFTALYKKFSVGSASPGDVKRGPGNGNSNSALGQSIQETTRFTPIITRKQANNNLAPHNQADKAAVK